MATVPPIRIEGAKALEDWMLRELPVRLARKATLSGMRASAKPMVALAKMQAPKRSGALAQAIGIKTVPARGGQTVSQLTKHVGGSDKTFAAIEIGALSGSSGAALHAWARYRAFYHGSISIRRGGKTVTKMIGRIRHSHLMEFGFKHKRSGRRIAPRKFLSPAFDGAYPTYARGFVRETRKKVEASIRRHNAKSRGPK